MGESELLTKLRTGDLHAFADFHDLEGIPETGAGLYTVWNARGRLVYVGIAGPNITGKGLRGRLKSHFQGRRSGDQLCVYVGDRYVLPALMEAERNAIATGDISMDHMIREYIRLHLAFRWAATEDYATAMRVESRVKVGALGEQPELNPLNKRNA